MYFIFYLGITGHRNLFNDIQKPGKNEANNQQDHFKLAHLLRGLHIYLTADIIAFLFNTLYNVINVYQNKNEIILDNANIHMIVVRHNILLGKTSFIVNIILLLLI